MEIKINLATRPYLNRRIVRRWLSLVCAFLGLLLGINLFYGLQNYQQLQKVEARYSDLDQQLVGLRGVSESFSPEKYAEIRKQVQAVNEVIAADQFLWTDLLSRFEELLPANVAIRNIRPDYRNRSFSINAYARDVTAMTDFLDALLQSDDFSQVYLKNQSEAQQVVNFSLVIEEAF